MNLVLSNPMNTEQLFCPGLDKIEDQIINEFVDSCTGFKEEITLSKSGAPVLHKNWGMPDKKLNQVEWKNYSVELLDTGLMIQKFTFQAT